MQNDDYIMRNDHVVWRDIAGEVVIAERDNSTIRVLNKVASVIWTLADGTKNLVEIADGVYGKFEVTTEQARRDSEEFIQELLDAQLVHISPEPVVSIEA